MPIEIVHNRINLGMATPFNWAYETLCGDPYISGARGCETWSDHVKHSLMVF